MDIPFAIIQCASFFILRSDQINFIHPSYGNSKLKCPLILKGMNHTIKNAMFIKRLKMKKRKIATTTTKNLLYLSISSEVGVYTSYYFVLHENGLMKIET